MKMKVFRKSENAILQCNNVSDNNNSGFMFKTFQSLKKTFF